MLGSDPVLVEIRHHHQPLVAVVVAVAESAFAEHQPLSVLNLSLRCIRAEKSQTTLSMR